MRTELTARLTGNIADDDPVWSMLDPLPVLEERIVALHATTAEGHTARAQCEAFEYLPRHRACQDNPDASRGDRFRAACLRDLTHLERGHSPDFAALPASPGPLLPAHPDADLIRICAERAVNLDTYNRDGGMQEIGKLDPLWDTYERTRNAIGASKPRTLEGMLAKVRAAKAEARRLDGAEDPEGSPAESWAWDLVNDLLAGRAGA